MAALRGTLWRFRPASAIYAAVQHQKEIIMFTRQRNSKLGELFMLLGNAIAAASAVSHGRQTYAGNLHRLGLDAEEFRRINRF
ncbi:hypothetical protein [Pseudaminobacter soli (ex Li et al. 2025)]|uniref:DUF1127 domain-containing protein n=1 Tax=Pseudaminobacter soli (ex Li et al. 2025) TaxID=1295366 RepID=A0A2P7S624_9HYPH|nr:hypothetical protein [Mesorhizobium soli]PSJ57923.1 hypothetical protein C7I85_21400 [Mesorhizobium soli]